MPRRLRLLQYVDFTERQADDESAIQEILRTLNMTGSIDTLAEGEKPEKQSPQTLDRESQGGDLAVQETAYPSSVLPPQTPVDFDWVRIPAGKFLYGEEGESIYLDEYHISRTPVTNAQYKVFVDATGYEAPRFWQNNRIPEGKRDNPVVGVSWYDAQEFSRWAEVSMPTELQWEKAARGTDEREYPWGDTPEPNEDLCNFNHIVGDTTPVGSYSPQGDSPYGVADMAGNVWEWVAYWFDEARTMRVVRGGSFNDRSWVVRCAFRFNGNSFNCSSSIGFRVVFPGF